MVGLYRDPTGEKISFMSNSVIDHSIGGSNEVRELQRRVTELENSLKRRVSIKILLWFYRHRSQLSMHVSPAAIYHKGAIAPLYSDRAGWPALLPYIRKMCVSVAIRTQSGICLHERVPMVKIWGSSKKIGLQKVVKIVKVHFHNSSSSPCCCCCCCSSSSSSSSSSVLTSISR